ncbi:MAG: hypothetical protein ABIQ12_11555 [Opitutaceae bacterium]
MNNQEARFFLGAYRPNGSDAGDPAFGEALLQVERDPELRQWLDRQRSFDAVVADRLQAIMPPPDLKQAILAGGRASRPQRSRWFSPAWLAAAAAITMIATVGAIFFSGRQGSPLSGFAAAALAELSSAHKDHKGAPAELAGLQARLAGARLPLLADAGIDLGELSRGRCRTVSLGGRQVFEICFQRDGAWFHLYAARRDDASSGATVGGKTAFASVGGTAAAAWMDANNVYALVTEAGEVALRRLI